MDELENIRNNKMKKMMEKIQIEDIETNNSETNGKTVHLSEANFNDFVGENNVVLVDCWAEWCGPCRMLGPTIDELAKEYAGKASIAKLNVDHNPMKAREYGIQGIPTMLLFKNGKLVDRLVGAMPKSAIVSKLNSII